MIEIIIAGLLLFFVLSYTGKISGNQFLKDNSDIEVYDYYTDDGFSGTTFNRPGFEKLLEEGIKTNK